MSLAAIRWALQQRAGSATAKAVLLVIADAADKRGVAYPSQAALAEATELTERSVRSAIGVLVASKLVRCQTRYRPGGSRASTRYVLPIIPEAVSGMPDANQPNDNDLQTIPEAPAGMDGAYRKDLPVCGGGIPEAPSALVPTVLEPVEEPPVVPLRGEKRKTKKSHRVPDEFVPNAEMRELADELRVDFAAELLKFRNYHFPEPHSNWNAALRNWLCRAKPAGRRTSGERSLYLRPGEVQAPPAQPTRMMVEHQRKLAANGGQP
jgi:hypothetical protein